MIQKEERKFDLERLAALGFVTFAYTLGISSYFYTILENRVLGNTFR